MCCAVDIDVVTQVRIKHTIVSRSKMAFNFLYAKTLRGDFCAGVIMINFQMRIHASRYRSAKYGKEYHKIGKVLSKYFWR